MQGFGNVRRRISSNDRTPRLCDRVRVISRQAQPPTEFGLARKFAYERSARGRNALPLDAFKTALETGRIDDELAAELRRRMEQKRRLGHVDRAPLRFFVVF